jgi:TetR/AcrR family transcriptional regulator
MIRHTVRAVNSESHPADKAPAKANKKSAKPASNAKPKAPRTLSPKAESRRLLLVEGKRNAIIQAALQLFSQFGLHGTSLDQVASSANVSKTNLLYYFAGKEDLYANVMQHLLDIWLSPLRGFNPQQDPLQAIGSYIRVKLELSRDHPAESRLFCMEVMQGAPLIMNQLEGPLRDLVANKVQVIQGWIDAGKLARIDPLHLIFSLWSTTQHYADFSTQVRAVSGKTLADPEFFEEVLANLQTLILRGIEPRA